MAVMSAVFAPPPELPPHLQQHSFWIWLQLVAIRLYVIALRGRLVAFTTATDLQGNTYLVHIGDAQPAAKQDPFAFEPSAAYRAAFGQGAAHDRIFHRPLTSLLHLWRLQGMDIHYRRYRRGEPGLLRIPDT